MFLVNTRPGAHSLQGQAILRASASRTVVCPKGIWPLNTLYKAWT